MFGDAENTPSSDVGPNPIQDKFGHPRSLNRSGVSRMVRDSDMLFSVVAGSGMRLKWGWWGTGTQGMYPYVEK